MIVAYLFISVWKIGITVLVYCLTLRFSIKNTNVLNMEILDCQYDNLGFMHYESVDRDGNWTETARFDRWILIYAFTTALTSYFGKVAVRIDLQTFGFAVPGITARVFSSAKIFPSIFSNSPNSELL